MYLWDLVLVVLVKNKYKITMPIGTTVKLIVFDFICLGVPFLAGLCAFFWCGGHDDTAAAATQQLLYCCTKSGCRRGCELVEGSHNQPAAEYCSVWGNRKSEIVKS